MAARGNANALHHHGARRGSRRGREDRHARDARFSDETKGLSREDAYLLASAAMDLMVTQVVDGTKGIHASIPKAIFQK